MLTLAKTKRRSNTLLLALLMDSDKSTVVTYATHIQTPLALIQTRQNYFVSVTFLVNLLLQLQIGLSFASHHTCFSLLR